MGFYLRLGWNIGSFGGILSLYFGFVVYIMVYGLNLVFMLRIYRNKEYDLKIKWFVKICYF